MSINPQDLREVEFRERFRGYDPDEVDDFLERAAVGVEQLHTQLRELSERTAEAERRLSEGADTEGALRQTLVLAQRTADSAVAEAQAAANKILADAQARADALLAEAGHTSQRMAEQTEHQVRSDVAALEAARARLQADIDSLEEYLTEERSRVRASLTELMWRLEERLDKGLTPRPALSAIEIPAPPPVPSAPRPAPMAPPPAAAPTGAPSGASPGAPPAAAGVSPAPNLPPATPSPPSGPPGLSELPAAAASAAPEPAVAPGGVQWGRPAPARSSGPRLVYTRPGAEPTPSLPPAEAGERSPDDTGPLEPISDVIEWPRNKLRAPHADDAFFAELRGALEDDEPLGPREATDSGHALDEYGGDVHDEPRGGSRFRRRRPGA